MANHRIVWDTFAPRNSRTKWEIMVERREFLMREFQEIDRYMAGLEKTSCGLTCDGCGVVLETEADFAAHFIVTDEAYLNLGNCPNSDKTNRTA